MENNKIEQLLEKFYRGETTEVEERALKEYFQSAEHIPSHLQADKRLFSALDEPSDVPYPEDFDKDLGQMVDQWAADEEEGSMRIVPKNNKHNWGRWLQIAACMALVVSSAVFFTNQNNHEIKDTYSDPEEAYQQTQWALEQLSAALNKGMDQLNEAEAKTAKAQECMDKQLLQIKKFKQ